MMISGINHLAISTRDMDRALGFYRDLIGLTVIADSPFGSPEIDAITALNGAGGRIVLLDAGNTQLELFEFSSPKAKVNEQDRPVCDHGLTHLCFDVTDIEQAYQHLKDAGITFHCEPLDFGWAKATYGRDPDGNVFELLEIVRPSGEENENH